MTAELLAKLVLGSGGLLTGIGLIWKIVIDLLDRRRTITKQQGEIEKQQVDVELTSEQINLIKAEAHQAYSSERMDNEKWWADQIERLRRDLATEERARRRLTEWANLHQIWDRRAWALALETDPKYPPPPTLDDE